MLARILPAKENGMAACPRASTCVLHCAVEPSIIKRVKFASIYSFCRGGQHEGCAVWAKLVNALPVPPNLMPDGTTGDYLDAGADGSSARRFLIIEDSPVFAALASSTIAAHFTGAEIVRRLSYDTAVDDLVHTDFSAIICGFGLGGDRTAHDVRSLTGAPIVVLTGRPDGVKAPHGAQVVQKGAGPEALTSAIRACLA